MSNVVATFNYFAMTISRFSSMFQEIYTSLVNPQAAPNAKLSLARLFHGYTLHYLRDEVVFKV